MIFSFSAKGFNTPFSSKSKGPILLFAVSATIYHIFMQIKDQKSAQKRAATRIGNRPRFAGGTECVQLVFSWNLSAAQGLRLAIYKST
ncbi:MAG: hypothetical protein E7449_05830 [Ruminococcaceae bacterium]|nr:hypothetical protein [Oscillospiraceae bacterium]